MPAPYDQKFRKKVIAYVNKGNSCHSASLIFGISPSTVISWHKKYKSEGNYLSRKAPGKKSTISDKDVMEYVNNNPNFSLSQVGKYFGISPGGAHYWLEKVGFKYKKK